MAEKASTFAKRLREGLDFSGMNQAELAARSGIDKSRISRYLKGTYKAKQDAVYELARALNVSEAWLMGYDVPMDPSAEREVAVEREQKWNTMSIGENIRQLRTEHNLSQAELGKIAGVSDKAVSTWEMDIKVPRMGAVEKMAAYFGIVKSAILDDSPALPAGAIPVRTGPMIPILGEIRCGCPMYAEQNISGYVPYKGNSGEAYFALRAVGDSMNAAGISDGDTVIVRQQDTVDPNTIAVVCVNGDEATLKRFRQDGSTVFLSPQSYNPVHQVQVYDLKKTPVHVMGRVMEVRKTF